MPLHASSQVHWVTRKAHTMIRMPPGYWNIPITPAHLNSEIGACRISCSPVTMRASPDGVANRQYYAPGYVAQTYWIKLIFRPRTARYWRIFRRRVTKILLDIQGAVMKFNYWKIFLLGF